MCILCFCKSRSTTLVERRGPSERLSGNTRSEFSLVRRATLPNPEIPLGNAVVHESEALIAELNGVKNLRALLNTTRFLVPHRDAAELVDEELASIANAFQDTIARTQNRARLEPFPYSSMYSWDSSF